MLGIAYFYSECQQVNKKIKNHEILIMCGSLFFGCFIKPVYIFLLIIPLFMKKNYFKNNKKEKFKYYSIVLFSILLFFVVFSVSVLINTKYGDSRGGDNVNPNEQIAFIFSNPLKFSFIFIDFFTNYLSLSNMINLSSSFAELTSIGKLTVARDFGIFIILLLILSIIDRNKYDKLTTK